MDAGQRRDPVVLDHVHDGSPLNGARTIFLNGTRMHGVARTKSMHVNAAVCFQLVCKFWC